MVFAWLITLFVGCVFMGSITGYDGLKNKFSLVVSTLMYAFSIYCLNDYTGDLPTTTFGLVLFGLTILIISLLVNLGWLLLNTKLESN